MISINFGDLSQRARRAFRLVGRLPLSLDETVLPVAVVAQLDTDPFRTEPRTWIWPQTITGTAVISGIAEISNPAGSAQLIVVYGFTGEASAAGGSQDVSFGVLRGVAGLLGAGIAQPVLINAAGGFLGQPAQSATRFRAGQNAGANGGQLGLFGLTTTSSAQLFFPSAIVLFPGDTFWLATKLAAVSHQLVVFGAEYVQTAP